MHDLFVRLRGAGRGATLAVHASISHTVRRPVVANQQTMPYMSCGHREQSQQRAATMRDLASLTNNLFFLVVVVA